MCSLPSCPSGDVLLLLDNCEHLVEACASLADALVRGCPKVWALATSRERLGVTGEVIVPVGGLELPDSQQRGCEDWLQRSEAGRLFIDGATRARPGFLPGRRRRSGRGQDLRAPRWHPLGPGAGGGPSPADERPCHCRGPFRPVPLARRERASRAAPPKNAPGLDRMELRPLERRRARPAATPIGVRVRFQPGGAPRRSVPEARSRATMSSGC